MATVKLYDLALGLARVTPCAAKGNSARPMLEHVCIEADGDNKTVTLIAADGWRLGKTVLPASQAESSFRKMLPATELAWVNVRKLAWMGLDIVLDPAQMADASGYPKYKGLFPEKEPTLTCILPSKLRSVLRSIKRFVDADQSVYWSITTSGHVLEIRQDKAASRWDIPTYDQPPHEPFWFCANYKLLSETLEAAHGEAELTLTAWSNNAPVVFTGAGGVSTWLLIPMFGDKNYEAKAAYREH